MRLGCPRSLMAYSLVPTRPVLSCETAYRGNVLSSLWKRLFLWRNADIKLRWSSIFVMSCTSCKCMRTLLEHPLCKVTSTPFQANMAINRKQQHRGYHSLKLLRSLQAHVRCLVKGTSQRACFTQVCSAWQGCVLSIRDLWLTLGVMPPHKYTPPVASALSPREPASAPMMAKNRSTASIARGSLPSKAAFVMAGASCRVVFTLLINLNTLQLYGHRRLSGSNRDIQLTWTDISMRWH